MICDVYEKKSNKFLKEYITSQFQYNIKHCIHEYNVNECMDC